MSKKRVLVIDDEEAFLTILKLNLEETGAYEVRTMSDGREVIKCLNEFHPDVILVDMVMPKIGGLEICELLNRDPLGLKTPVIVLSALDKDIDKLKAFKKGVIEYITKPVDNNMLIAKIKKVLS